MISNVENTFEVNFENPIIRFRYICHLHLNKVSNHVSYKKKPPTGLPLDGILTFIRDTHLQWNMYECVSLHWGVEFSVNYSVYMYNF